jgi:hypothetical protein
MLSRLDKGLRKLCFLFYLRFDHARIEIFFEWNTFGGCLNRRGRPRDRSATTAGTWGSGEIHKRRVNEVVRKALTSGWGLKVDPKLRKELRAAISGDRDQRETMDEKHM